MIAEHGFVRRAFRVMPRAISMGVARFNDM
jgi:hypothetical protein